MKEKSKQVRFLVLLAFSVVLGVNSIIINSTVIGTVASIGFLFLVCVAIGEVFYSSENLFFKGLFGLATFLLLLAICGFGLMLIGMFTEILSLLVLLVIGVFFAVISLRGGEGHFRNFGEGFSVNKGSAKKDLNSYLLIFIFLFYVAVAFRFLLLARTSEGGSSVWLEISPLFIPTFAVVSLILASLLFFTSLSDSIKLVMVVIYAFLQHSLFLIVWYPSRYGDPLVHLGSARYTARTGAIYAFGWLTSNFLIVTLVSYRAQYALVIFFERMFSIDIYWAHALFVPLLWSIFVPSLAYKTAELLTVKRSKVFPLLAAFSSGLFSSLIIWGTVSVPNSLGFIFFFLSAVLLLKWMTTGGKCNWLISLLAVGVTFLAHPQPGIFALMLFLCANVVQRSARKALKIASLLLTFALYPIVLYFYGASFSASGLFVLDNFLSFQSVITSILLVFGLLGLVLGLRGRYLAKSAFMFFAFYVAILFEYYLTMFGMLGTPYGPARILVMGDFLLVPFIALGLFRAIDIVRRAFISGKGSFSFGLFSKKTKINLNYRFLTLVFICLFVSLQATSTLYQAYPHKEVVPYQPAEYMIEAINYIDADAPGRYVVLCDPIISSVAIGFLGIDYGWAGGIRGFFGMPDWEYPTVDMYWSMTKHPSIDIMRRAMDFGDAVVSYFVVWVTHPNFDNIVQQTSEILPVNRVFGDGQLYVFRYPLPVIQEPGPSVKVVFDDGASTEYRATTFTYMFETEINATLTLSGYSSYNVTEYPLHWVFLDLMVNNVSRQLDDTSDVNTFVYVRGLEPDDVLTVKWRWNRNYPVAVWKEDSFKSGWRTHDVYRGTIENPTIVSDGDILNMSYSFTPGHYWYYYYIKPVDIDITGDASIIIRWRSDAPIAVAAYYYELGLQSGVDVVPIGSESIDWTVTVVKLPENIRVTYVMIGINNLKTRDMSGMKTLSVDYIFIATSS